MSDTRLKAFQDILAGIEEPFALSRDQVCTLAIYYGMVLKWNSRLHLTTITDPREFVGRHILEALEAVPLIPSSVDSIWDLGTGLGVPGIPLAIVLAEKKVNLVESSLKKTIFLEEVVRDLRLDNVRVVRRRIEDLEPLSGNSLLTARAVESMADLLPDLLRIGDACPRILLYGGRQLVEKTAHPGGRTVHIHALAGADNRFLIRLDRST